MSFELQSVSSERRQSTAIVPPPVPNIGDLPQELCNQIFGNLGLRDVQAAACVSRSMNGSVIAAAHCNEFHSIRNFIKSLMQKLPEQKEQLAKIAQNITSQNFPHLLLLKRSILDVKAQLIGVIKTVGEERANGLRQVKLPHFFEDIFTLAAIERRIDEINLMPNGYMRWYALRAISKALVEAGDIDRSLVFAKSIANEELRFNTFLDISQELTRAGNIDRAIALVTSISDEGVRGYGLWAKGKAFRNISQALTQAGNIDKSLEVATLIPNEDEREYALRDISEALAQKGDIDRSLEVATSIHDEETRGYALRDICKALIEAGNIDRSLSVATSIPNDRVRGEALQDISNALIHEGNRERALAVADLIPLQNVRRDVLADCYLQ